MNERIKTLAEQAGFYFYDMHDVDGQDLGETIEADSWTAAEKFAELLVRECMDIALKQKKWVEDQKVFNDHDEQWNRARIQQSQHIVVKIREHFGVE